MLYTPGITCIHRSPLFEAISLVERVAIDFPSLQVKALGCDGSTSLVTWLDGLGLHEYLPNFLSSGYRTLECVKNLWELEIVNVRSTTLTFSRCGFRL